ncbi:MAG: hypothetical protein NPMRIOTA_20022 [Nitrosopumilales archaeon]|nr:MAG: hypothetical protein NPMRIOTA_20022 [Nitrosopumilales archaeon]
MTDPTFSDFYNSLLDLSKSFEEKNLQLKIEPDLDANIVKIFGEKIDSISRAKTGLDDLAELAYTTAEHHPYWSLIYHSSQISKIALDKWDDDLTKEELDEIEWSVDELKNNCKRLKEKTDTKN